MPDACGSPSTHGKRPSETPSRLVSYPGLASHHGTIAVGRGLEAAQILLFFWVRDLASRFGILSRPSRAM
jgi:hypothetical protein